MLDRETLRQRRVIFPDEESLAADAYRMLRTQLLQRVRQRGARVIGVASPADGDGKTLTSVNLALALAAEPNQTILLVDMDLRRPERRAACWEFPRRAASRACCAARSASTRPCGAPRVVIAWRSCRPRRSAFFVRIARGRTHASLPAGDPLRYPDRLVVLDLPPVLLTDDVLTLAPLLDGILLVIAEQRTRREDLQRAQTLAGGVPQLGSVLNRATRSERRAY